MASPVWKGFISFGLVSFPVRLSAAARADPVRFHMLHRKDLSRIKEVFYCAEEDKPVERSEIVKGFESAKGEYVTVDDEELKKIAPPTATSMDILQTVANGAVDPIFSKPPTTSRRMNTRERLIRCSTLRCRKRVRMRLRSWRCTIASILY
jgi:DNA end-binding protein Ku